MEHVIELLKWLGGWLAFLVALLHFLTANVPSVRPPSGR
jgi:hypothetical protein